MHLRKFCFTKPEAHNGRARQSCRKRRAQEFTYGVPHDDVHVCTERIVNVLSEVEIQEVTEVVVHVNTWSWEREHVKQEKTHNGMLFESTLPAYG